MFGLSSTTRIFRLPVDDTIVHQTLSGREWSPQRPNHPLRSNVV